MEYNFLAIFVNVQPYSFSTQKKITDSLIQLIVKKVTGNYCVRELWVEGCPIYPHRVESSMISMDSNNRKSSVEILSVKYTKDMG